MVSLENNLKAVDFFCSGGGMTNGFTKAGIDVIAGIDIDIKCKETYEKNNKNSQFICKDIFEYSEKELELCVSIIMAHYGAIDWEYIESMCPEEKLTVYKSYKQQAEFFLLRKAKTYF